MKKNVFRQKITEEIVIQVEKQIKENFHQDDKIIIASAPSMSGHEDVLWNEGVIGLVASRICEKYYLPTLIVTKNDEVIKGSGRSIEEFNITSALEEAKDFLDKYGGHKAACGFSVKSAEQYEKFVNKIKEISYTKLGNLNLIPKILIDAEIKLIQINFDLLSLLVKLSPYGEGNSKPRFLSWQIKVVDVIKMGKDGQHLKLKIKEEDSKIYNAIGFGQSAKYEIIKIGDIIDIVYYLEINNFNGKEEIQLKIIDIKYE